MVSEKLDLYKLHKDEYIAPKKPALVKIKPARYLAITGQGEPGGEQFSTASIMRSTSPIRGVCPKNA